MHSILKQFDQWSRDHGTVWKGHGIGLELVDIFNHQGYRHSQWMVNEGWFDDMTTRVVDKWKRISVSPTSTMSSPSTPIDVSVSGLLEWLTNEPPKGLSSSDGRLSVLPSVESEWWQDKSSCHKSSQRLILCGGRMNPHVKSPPSPSDWVHVVAGQKLLSKALPVIEFMWW